MMISPFMSSQVPVNQTGMLPMPFEGGMPGFGGKTTPFGPGIPAAGAGPDFSRIGGWLGPLIQRLMAARGSAQPAAQPAAQMPQFGNGIFGQLMQQVAGRVSGGTGARGPDPNPFTGLAGLAGPFGNGGGPIAPNFTSWTRGPNKRFF